MKKILAIILMTALLVCPVLASGEAAAAPATASAEPAVEATPCDHVFAIVDSAEATCTEDGYTVYECTECGVKWTFPVAATGEHDYVVTVKDATCTADGATVYTCTMCGDSYSEPIPATGHVANIPAATCTENQVCTVCGEVLQAASGHAYTYQYDAVTAEDGSYVSFGTWKCDNCGDVLAATEGNAVYYYALKAAEEEAAAASGEPSGEASAEASDEASGEVAEETAASSYDPAAYNWSLIEIVLTVVIVVVFAVLMLSFGKTPVLGDKKKK